MKKALTLPKLKKKLQIVFNRYIRERDSEDGWFTCISCGMTKRVDQMDAGHYYPVKGYDGLRFDEDNCSGECKYCNGFDQSHLIGYTLRLPEKIGDIRFQKLVQKAADYKKNGNFKWSRHDLQAMLDKYNRK